MFPKCIVVLSGLAILSLSSLSAFGAESANQEKAPYFTNKDLEERKAPSAPAPYEKKTAAPEKKKKSDDKDKEYWCTQGTRSRKDIEKAEREVKALEQGLAEERDKGLPQEKKRAKTATQKLAKAKKQLKEAQEGLDELENRAHRKGVPPGWLRCQFSY